MKIFKLFCFAVAISALFFQSCSSGEENNPVEEFETIEVPVTNEIAFSDAERVVNYDINKFGIKAFSNIVYQNPNNIAFSPISALLALAVYDNTKVKVYGASSNLGALIWHDNLDDLNSICNKLLRFLPYSNNQNSSICFANSVWLNNKISTLPSFKEFLNTEYYAELYRYNPYDNTNENSLQERIRRWVEIKTKGEISDYKLDGDDSSSLVFNVTYFKEEWLNKFDASKTVTDTFYGSNGTTTAEMMKGDFSNIQYMRTVDWKGVVLPLNGNYDVYFILPEPGVSIKDIVNPFDVFSEKDSPGVDVTITLPKFSIENNRYLSSYIDEGGNFGANVKQITKFEIDENGAKAVAVTEVTDSATPSDKIELTFNRPFLYALVNRVTETYIMLGTVCTF